jgi:hypothetical protein
MKINRKNVIFAQYLARLKLSALFFHWLFDAATEMGLSALFFHWLFDAATEMGVTSNHVYFCAICFHWLFN